MQAGNGNIEIKSGIYIFIIFFMPLSFFLFRCSIEDRSFISDNKHVSSTYDTRMSWSGMYE